MATLLARITIKDGCEARWETVIEDLVAQTFANERDVIRYEYWKSQQPRTWYGLLSFTGKQGFFAHQDADYHRNQPYGDLIEDINLEFVDPVSVASPLPRTTNPPLPDNTPPNITEWETLSPVVTAQWWQQRK